MNRELAVTATCCLGGGVLSAGDECRARRHEDAVMSEERQYQNIAPMRDRTDLHGQCRDDVS